MRRVLPFLFLFTTLLTGQDPEDRHQPFPPFRIAGNIYYVGTGDLASYLIPTPAGHILINTNYEQDVPLIRNSVENLGFKFGDIKIVLLSHAHDDHVARDRGCKEGNWRAIDSDGWRCCSHGEWDYRFSAFRPALETS